MSKKITLSADEATATVTAATVGDIFSGLFDPDVALTGAFKYVQLVGVGAAAMMYGNKRHTGAFLNFGG